VHPRSTTGLFQQQGVDAVPVPLKPPATALPGFIEHGLKADNIGGCWATMPNKAALAALFDGIGFVKGLDHFGIAVAGRRVLVVGAGGGGHAVAAALAQRGRRRWRSSTARWACTSLVARPQPLAGAAAGVVDIIMSKAPTPLLRGVAHAISRTAWNSR
jgi:shikimate dehydrogenase